MPIQNGFDVVDEDKTVYQRLLGKTVTAIERGDFIDGNDTLLFKVDDGSVYAMYHAQDCCEHVVLEDIVGDLDDLIGSPLLRAYESFPPVEAEPEHEDYDESHTWTFYHFATTKGYVTLRWYGSSNGYYSESVDFVPLEQAGPADRRAIELDGVKYRRSSGYW